MSEDSSAPKPTGSSEPSDPRPDSSADPRDNQGHDDRGHHHSRHSHSHSHHHHHHSYDRGGDHGYRRGYGKDSEDRSYSGRRDWHRGGREFRDRGDGDRHWGHPRSRDDWKYSEERDSKRPKMSEPSGFSQPPILSDKPEDKPMDAMPSSLPPPQQPQQQQQQPDPQFMPQVNPGMAGDMMQGMGDVQPYMSFPMMDMPADGMYMMNPYQQPMQMYPPPPQRGHNSGRYQNMENKVHASGFPESTTEAELKEAFMKFGTVKSVNIRRAAQKGSIPVYAFVEFTDQSAAQNALRHRTTIVKGKSVLIKEAVSSRNNPMQHNSYQYPMGGPQGMSYPGMGGYGGYVPPQQQNTGVLPDGGVTIPNKIYIGNISVDVTEDEIRNTFGQFGEILKTEFRTQSNGGKHKCFCFVEYKSSESADEAVRQMNRQIYYGRPLTVFKKKAQEGESAGATVAPVNPMGGYGMAEPSLSSMEGMHITNEAQKQELIASLMENHPSASAGSQPAEGKSGEGAGEGGDKPEGESEEAKEPDENVVKLSNLDGEGDVSDETLESEVKNDFESCGKILNIKVYTDPSSKKFVYIRFDSSDCLFSYHHHHYHH